MPNLRALRQDYDGVKNAKYAAQWKVFDVPADRIAGNWTGYMIGPARSPFHGCRLPFKISFPLTYPLNLSPPVITFQPVLYHPNIETETGEVMSPVLGNPVDKRLWTRHISLDKVLLHVHGLLLGPPASGEFMGGYPANCRVMEEYEQNIARFITKAKASAQAAEQVAKMQ